MGIQFQKVNTLAKIMAKNLMILVFIMFFMTGYVSIFGQENSLTGVGIITSFIFLLSTDLGLKRRSGVLVLLYLLLSTNLLPYFASFHPLLGFMINFIGIFSIMLFTSMRMDYKMYVIFVLMYVFNEGNPVYHRAFIMRIISILLFGSLIMLLYWFKHREDEEHYRILEIPHLIAEENLAFGIKLAFSLSLAMLISQVFHINKHMWFTITVLSLTQIQAKEAFMRMKHRTINTVLGSMIYVFFIGYFIPKHLLIYFTLIFNYAYSFINRYDIKILFITVNTLLANQIFFNSNIEAALARIILVIFGVIFTYAITKINFKDIGKKTKTSLIKMPYHV